MRNIFISVIIPAYNEELRIQKTLEGLKKYFSQKKYFHEIIIADDGSIDKTTDVVLRFKDDLNISVIANELNYGKGYSVKKGMLASSGEYKLFMDADNSVSIENLDKFLPYFDEGFDIIIGSIEINCAKIRENVAPWRSRLGRLSKLLIRFVALPDIFDSQRGFKVFSKKAADIIFQKQMLNGFGFDIEILTIATRHSFKIKELPIVWSNPEGSKVCLKHYFLTLLELFTIKKNTLLKRYDRQR